MSNSVRPRRRQPTRLLCPWNSSGENTGVGCHFLLECIKVKCESEIAQSCLTLSNLMDCSLPGSPVHGIFQARVLWVAISFSQSILVLMIRADLWSFLGKSVLTPSFRLNKDFWKWYTKLSDIFISIFHLPNQILNPQLLAANSNSFNFLPTKLSISKRYYPFGFLWCH